MSDKTKIEWTDATWNPVTGCTKVSPGCDHCYAERVTNRFQGPGAFDTVVLHPDRLDQPLRWRRPRKVFVNSMSDLFHDDVPDEFIARVWAVMALAPQHTFQVLTKRHGRMRSILASDRFADLFADALYTVEDPTGHEVAEPFAPWPLPNVWLGVSVENQQWADIRIPALLDTPAAVRFISAEPLLGSVDLGSAPFPGLRSLDAHRPRRPLLDGVDWVIVGGESGPDARPMHPAWARLLRDECARAGVPFLFKQWGEWAEHVSTEDGYRHLHIPAKPTRDITAMHPAGMTALNPDNPFDPFRAGHPDWTVMRRVGKARAGRELDGQTWDQYPEQVPA